MRDAMQSRTRRTRLWAVIARAMRSQTWPFCVASYSMAPVPIPVPDDPSADARLRETAARAVGALLGEEVAGAHAGFWNRA